jgi:hypothetical protein
VSPTGADGLASCCNLGLGLCPPLPMNVAETAVAAPIVIVQVGEDPEQPPLQPTNVARLLVGVAVSLSTVPLGYAAEQTEPQLIPEGLLVTVPGPEVVTVRAEVARLKLAVTVTGGVIRERAGRGARAAAAAPGGVRGADGRGCRQRNGGA